MATKKRKKKSRKLNKLENIKRRTDANISEAIIKITNSFIENNLDEAVPDFQLMLNLSVITWNISIFPKVNQEIIYGQIAEMFPQDFSAKDISGFVTIIEKIIDEKRKYYPGVNRLIEKIDISIVDGNIKLDVRSIPFGEKRD